MSHHGFVFQQSAQSRTHLSDLKAGDERCISKMYKNFLTFQLAQVNKALFG
jgi:hypothetical protein